MPREREDQRDDEIQDSPVYWFSRFEAALQRFDLALALEAQRRLSKLGFSVVCRQFRRTKGGVR